MHTARRASSLHLAFAAILVQIAGLFEVGVTLDSLDGRFLLISSELVGCADRF